MGIRLAVGADGARLRWEVVRQGVIQAALGAILGLAAALALGRFLSGQLFGVAATDPTTLAASAALLIAISAAASYLPARRASRVDPAEILRAE